MARPGRQLAMLCTTLFLAAAPALADTRVALVVGNSEYEAVGRLENYKKICFSRAGMQ